MTKITKSALAIAGLLFSAQAAAQITLYSNENFQGRPLTTRTEIDDMRAYGFNDRASSAVVTSRRWELCEDIKFRGRCVYLRPGQYPSLAAMGLNDRFSSVRMVGRGMNVPEARYAPPPARAYDYGRRGNERLFEADVVSVRAVVGPPEQRCWVERERVRDTNVGGAIAGAVIGGILGHQVGHGTGQDLATVGGAVAGGAIGSSVGGRRGQDVQRCENVPAQAPSFWDVTYRFRGQEHSVQMTSPPGPTITVNRQGEPRV